MRVLMQIAHKARAALLRRLGLRSRGVKVMVFNDRGELLLIRNSYGRSDLYLLPGGGIGRFETPEAAAVREVKEEVGLDVHGLARVSTHFSTHEGKRDTIHLFRATCDAEPTPDGREVVEARFVGLDDLPEDVSPATLRRIAEHKGRRPSPAW